LFETFTLGIKMKFSADRKKLSGALTQVQGITSRKTNLSITSDVLIKAAGSELIITANDLETVFCGTYEADVESDGMISINSKKIFEIIKEYPDTQFPVNEIENRWVEIGEGNIQYHIVSSDCENFPETPLIENISFIEVDSVQLKKMVDVASVIGFSPDEKRIYVLGALLEKVTEEDGNILRMVSTDSRRLNCIDIPYVGNFDIPEETIIIPKKGLSELSKFIDNQGTLQIGVKDNHFIAKKANEMVMIKLLSGDYPDYRRVLNTESFTPIEINRAMFFLMMKRMSILVSEDYKSVIFNFKENELVVTITNPEIGESKEEFPITYSGEPFESAFNPRFFIDAINVIKNDTLTLHVKDSRNPCVVQGSDNTQLICAIMAMSV